MVALTADTQRVHQEPNIISYGIEAAEIIYKGALCKINADGYLEACSAEAGAVFAGVAYEGVSNASGANGAVDARVMTEGILPFAATGLAATNVGNVVYATDDNTVQTAAGTNLQKVGRITEVISATECKVQIFTLDI